MDVLLGPGNGSGQGHEDQWLAVLSQCGLEPDDPVVYRGKNYTIDDLVNQAKWDIHDGMEASWTVIGLTEYLPLDADWTAKDGSQWTIERIMAMEAKQDLDESACGGSHRLIGMTMALARYVNEGRTPRDGWAQAEKVIDDTIDVAKKYQQPNGAFSSSYFRRASSTPDVAKSIGTTGHTLEFLALALREEELSEPWMTRAVAQLCGLLETTRDMPVECGALYHAAHGLQVYRLRRFGQREFPTSPAETAETEPTTTAESPGTVR